MSTDIKPSKAKLPKNFHSGEFLHNILGNFGKKVIADLPIPLARDSSPG